MMRKPLAPTGRHPPGRGVTPHKTKGANIALKGRNIYSLGQRPRGSAYLYMTHTP